MEGATVTRVSRSVSNASNSSVDKGAGETVQSRQPIPIPPNRPCLLPPSKAVGPQLPGQDAPGPGARAERERILQHAGGEVVRYDHEEVR